MSPRFGPGRVRGEEFHDGAILHNQTSRTNAQNCANQDIRVDDEHLSVCLFALRDAPS